MSILAERLTVKKCACCKETLDVWNTQKEVDQVCEECVKDNPNRCGSCIAEQEPCFECKLDLGDES